jgi:hypothetical protein
MGAGAGPGGGGGTGKRRYTQRLRSRHSARRGSPRNAQVAPERAQERAGSSHLRQPRGQGSSSGLHLRRPLARRSYAGGIRVSSQALPGGVAEPPGEGPFGVADLASQDGPGPTTVAGGTAAARDHRTARRDWLRDRFAMEFANFTDADRRRSVQAVNLAARLHADDRRQREPYLNHLLRVARASCATTTSAMPTSPARHYRTTRSKTTPKISPLGPGRRQQESLALLAGQFGERVAEVVGTLTNADYERAACTTNTANMWPPTWRPARGPGSSRPPASPTIHRTDPHHWPRIGNGGSQHRPLVPGPQSSSRRHAPERRRQDTHPSGSSTARRRTIRGDPAGAESNVGKRWVSPAGKRSLRGAEQLALRATQVPATLASDPSHTPGINIPPSTAAPIDAGSPHRLPPRHQRRQRSLIATGPGPRPIC